MTKQMTPRLDFRIAALCTEVRPNSHADAIIGRWLAPFASDASVGWAEPVGRIVSIHAAQRHPQRDLLPAWQERFGIEVHDTIRGALTRGADHLDVDAVLLIAEHGDYPENSFGQKLYPRKEFFDSLIEVFDQSGRVAPVFFDKHLSWNPDWILEMWKAVEKRGIPFFAGSSIPFSTPPPLCTPPPAPRNSAALFFGALESYLFHAVEMIGSLGWGLQSGTVSINAAEGEGCWRALECDPMGWSLLESAANACGPGGILGQLRQERNSEVVLFTLTDDAGSKIRFFREPGLIRKWAAATRHPKETTARSVVADVRGQPGFHPHFARLCVEIGSFFQTSRVPFPASRITTNSLITAYCMRSRKEDGQLFTLPTFPLSA